MSVLAIIFLPFVFCEFLDEFRERDWMHGIGLHHLDGNLEAAPSAGDVMETLHKLIPDVTGSEVVHLKKKPLRVVSFGKKKSPVILTEHHIRLLQNNATQHDVTILSGMLFPDSPFVLSHTTLPLASTCTENQRRAWDCAAAPECRLTRPRLTVMSYNIWNLNQRREFNYFDRIQAIADQILTLEIDVVAFQEVRLTNHEYPSNTSKSGSQVRDLSDRLPNYQFVYQTGMLYQHGSDEVSAEGVAIFSRYPILSHGFKYLSRNFSDNEDQQHQRVCLAALIATPLGVVTVATTHSSLSKTARLRNVVELIDFLYEFPFPHIVAGDFNAESESQELQHILGNRALGGRMVKYHSALKLEGMSKEKDWTYTTLSTSPRKMIDFIFYANSHYDHGNKKVTCNTNDASTNEPSPEADLASKRKEIRCLCGLVVKNSEPTPDNPVIPSDHRAIMAIFGPDEMPAFVRR